MGNEMKRILLVAAMALTGCQQLNDGVNTVNGAISSSLSSVGKALGELPPLKALARYRLYLALVLSAKTMKKTQWQQKRNGGKRISISNATVLEVTKGRSASDMMTGMPKSAPNYYLLFKTADTSYCGGMVWLDYYSGIDDAVLTYKKGQKVSVTGTVNNFEVRGFATVNNADMPVRLVVLRNGTINH
jgi:hypothetical protein